MPSMMSWCATLIIVVVCLSVLGQCNGVSSIRQRQAVVVGGGPSGLSSALMLSRLGWRVAVVERRDMIFDSDRAYMYLVDGRGQRCTGQSIVPDSQLSYVYLSFIYSMYVCLWHICICCRYVGFVR
jgi:FAD binding domain